MISVTVNGKKLSVESPPDTPILWVLRDELHMTGTKFGCGVALCGACTVHLDGEPVRSCATPVSAAAGKKITTIEAMSFHIRSARRCRPPGSSTTCRSAAIASRGQIMSASALLAKNKKPSDADIDSGHERQRLPLRHL